MVDFVRLIIVINLFQDKLIELINDKVLQYVQSHNIGIVIIDSIAAVLRFEQDVNERTQKVRIIASKLTEMSMKFNFPVLCVNQVYNLLFFLNFKYYKIYLGYHIN